MIYYNLIKQLNQHNGWREIMINTNSINVQTSYPVSENFCSTVNKALVEKPENNANNTAYLAEGVLKRVKLISVLDEYHKKDKNNLRPSGRAGEARIDIETINKEIKEIADKSILKIKESLNAFLETLNGNIQSNPARNIKILSINNFGGNSLLTSLILTACGFDEDSKIFKTIKNIGKIAEKSSTDADEIFKESLRKSKKILLKKKNTKDKTSAAIALGGAILSIYLPARLIGSALTIAGGAAKLAPDNALNESIERIEILQ